MIERLAVPQWNAPARTIEDWVAEFTRLGHRPRLVPEPPEAVWLELGSLRLRGYVVIEEGRVSAINFELTAPDAAEGLRVLELAAKALGFELHSDQADEDDTDD